MLVVEVVKLKNLSEGEKLKINGTAANVSLNVTVDESEGRTNINDGNTPVTGGGKVLGEAGSSGVGSTSGDGASSVEAGSGVDSGLGGGSRYQSKQQWLNNLRNNFLDIAVGGLEVTLRKKVSELIEQKKPLKGKNNQAVINSINHHVYEFIGNQRPDKALCR